MTLHSNGQIGIISVELMIELSTAYNVLMFVLNHTVTAELRLMKLGAGRSFDLKDIGSKHGPAPINLFI